MVRVIDFQERLSGLQRRHVLAVSRLMTANNMLGSSGPAMGAVSYRDIMVEVEDAAREVLRATEEIVEWMRYHADVRESDGLPPLPTL